MRWCGLQLCHAVADPAHIQDVGRTGRFIAELAAELFDEGADPVRVTGVRTAPHLADQQVVAHYPPHVFRKYAQKVVLPGSRGRG